MEHTILLVDDEPAILEREKNALKPVSSEFRVIGEAYSVHEALAKFDQERPDIVISDICMPEQSGIELVRHIFDSGSNTVSIVLSGYSDFEYVHDAFIYGAMDYILKPIEAQRLIETLHKAAILLEKLSGGMQEESISDSSKLYRSICNYVKQNLRADNSSLRICAEFGISQSQLGRLFKRKSTVSFNEFVTQARIDRAKELLDRGEDVFVGEVADLVGFNDPYYFSKVFKKQTGMTPRDYRNRKGH